MIGGAVVAVGLTPLLGLVFWRDYNLFMSYGAGGLPHNVFGWVLSAGLLRMMSAEMLGTIQYYKSNDKRTWLPHHCLPFRAGLRPLMGSHPVPQRQLSQIPDEEIKAVLHYPCSFKIAPTKLYPNSFWCKNSIVLRWRTKRSSRGGNLY